MLAYTKIAVSTMQRVELENLYKKNITLYIFFLIVSTSLIGLSVPELQLRREFISEKSLIQ